MTAGGTVLEIDRVISVQVAPTRDTIRISRPESARGIECGQTERVGVFAQTIDIGLVGQIGLQAKILRLEDDRMLSSVEQDFIVGRAHNGEREGRCRVIEADSSTLWKDRAVCLRARENGVRNFVTCLGGISDLDMNSCL